MSDAITPVAKTVALSATTTVAVANVATNTNTFHFLNASSSVYAYVGVFPTYAEAAAMVHPSTGTAGNGIPLSANESMTIRGDFGTTGSTSTVYIAAITATGTTSVFATPIGR